jgi:uncharacterized membrane protein SirB2
VQLIEFFPQVRHFHMACAAASLALFVTRGVWMLRGSPMLQRRWVRVVPHLVDTLLLASALTLAAAIRQYPFVDAWLTAKVIALLAYIGLGTVALKRGRTVRVRAAAFIAALLVFGYIGAVARTHQVVGFLPGTT